MGVVFFYIISGSEPFSNTTNESQLIRKILKGFFEDQNQGLFFKWGTVGCDPSDKNWNFLNNEKVSKTIVDLVYNLVSVNPKDRPDYETIIDCLKENHL